MVREAYRVWEIAGWPSFRCGRPSALTPCSYNRHVLSRFGEFTCSHKKDNRIDLNGQFTVDRAKKLHEKKVKVGAVSEGLSLGVNSSTMDSVDADDGQGDQAEPDSASVGT